LFYISVLYRDNFLYSKRKPISRDSVVVHVDGVRLSLNCGHRQAYCSSPQTIYERGGTWWNDIDRGTSLSAALSTTNPTWTDLSANLDIRGERPVSNHLSHVMS
jgi:hypothetical protein